MGGRSGCHGVEEHVACPDLPHFEGVMATGTLVDESLKWGLETTAVLYRNLSKTGVCRRNICDIIILFGTLHT